MQAGDEVGGAAVLELRRRRRQRRRQSSPVPPCCRVLLYLCDCRGKLNKAQQSSTKLNEALLLPARAGRATGPFERIVRSADKNMHNDADNADAGSLLVPKERDWGI